MKKILTAAIVTAFCICTALGAGATAGEGNIYRFDELYMELTAPDGYMVLTRESPEGDPGFEIYDASREEVLKFFEKNNIYMSAVIPDGEMGLSSEIVVTMVTNDNIKKVFDYNRLTDEDIESIMDQLDREYARQNVEVLDKTVYQSDSARYVVIDLKQQVGDAAVHTKQYGTFYNGLAIYITMYSYAGELTGKDRTVLENVVDSVTFTEVLPVPDNAYKPGSGSIGTFFSGAVIAVGAFLVGSMISGVMRRKKYGNTVIKPPPGFIAGTGADQDIDYSNVQDLVEIKEEPEENNE